jgi:hypothetical protein
MSEYIGDRMSEYMPERLSEYMTDRMSEDMPERMSEDMPDRMPNRMSEDMSDRMPEDLPVRKCINVMVGITRSKVIFKPWYMLYVYSFYRPSLFRRLENTIQNPYNCLKPQSKSHCL